MSTPSPAQPGNYSLAESLALLPPDQQAKIIRETPEAEAAEIHHDWRFWGRPKQILPGTARAQEQRADWRYWIVLAGRGFGKTRVGAEAVREWAENPKERILMIAPTASDVREVMIEGPAGLLSCYPSHRRPEYNSSRHLVTFPSGAIAFTRSADEPERLRGPQFTKFWADELAAWRYVDEAWAQISFGFRLKSDNLRGLITTTPKPLDLLKKLIKNPKAVVTRGSSFENRANLSEAYYEDVIAPYVGTRLGRQEIEAEILEDVPGALWSRQLIEATRVRLDQVNQSWLVRTVVAIDPAVSATDTSDETGIIVASLTNTGHILIFDDLTCRESPARWAAVAVAAYRSRRADRIVGEVNNGGDLVEANIRVAAPEAAFTAVRASRGKAVRAEPVVALYEQGRCHHVGSFPDLEDQMCSWVPGSGEKSPDRMDALVWACTELVVDPGLQTRTVTYVQDYTISPY